MNKIRVLYITQEMEPYTDFSDIASYMKSLVLNTNKNSFELRILMPKYGIINERRHKLHEVVRLSGMNIIIDDDDFPLIIKVASLPDSRVQVYFLDNEEFFKKDTTFHDQEGNPLSDNDSRMIFFCKGAMETVKKFGWPPDIIHVTGWMSSMVPLFLKKAYNNDPVYERAKVIYTPVRGGFIGELSDQFRTKVLINDMEEGDLEDYLFDDTVQLDKGAINISDGILLHSTEGMDEILDYAEKTNKPIYIHNQDDDKLTGEIEFYKSILEEA